MLAQNEVPRYRGRYLPETPASVAKAGNETAHNGSFSTALELMGNKRSFERGTEIFGQDEPADYVYRLVDGAAMTSRLLNDGRRQVGGFHFPGDILGLEAGALHRFSAETISKTTMVAVKRSTLAAIAQADAAVARELWHLTARALDRMHHLALLLGRSSAQERVSCFLAEMAERLDGGAELELPMSRKDIADHLGLTIETVSRTLSQMERDSLIEFVSSRRIILRNRAAFRKTVV